MSDDPTSAVMTAAIPPSVANDITDLLRGYELSLRARNRSPKTITGYLQTVELFRASLSRVGMPTAVDRLTREHVEAFIADQVQRWKPKTAHVRYGDLRQFFNWLVEEGEAPTVPRAACGRSGLPVRPHRHLAAPSAAMHLASARSTVVLSPPIVLAR